MRNWIVVALAIMFIFAGSASASVTTVYERGLDVPAVTGLAGVYSNTCAEFRWNAIGDADFNNFIVSITSNNSDLVKDVNTRTARYSACTMAPGEWVQAIVYRIDGNIDGYFLSLEPDATAFVDPGTVTQAGTFLIFNIFAAIGSLVGLIILVAVIAMMFKKLNFKLSLK